LLAQDRFENCRLVFRIMLGMVVSVVAVRTDLESDRDSSFNVSSCASDDSSMIIPIPSFYRSCAFVPRNPAMRRPV